MGSKLRREKSLTRIEYREINYSWTIQNFSVCDERHKLESEIFPKSDDVSNHKWQLWIYPYGKSEKSKNCLSIFLSSMSAQDGNVITAFSKFDCQNTDGKILKSYDYERDSYTNDKSFWGWEKFANHTEIIPFLKNDTLIINCWVKWELGVVNVPNEAAMVSAQPNAQGYFFNHFNELMNSGNYSDVGLVTSDGTKFSVHKCVLAARSPYFANKFKYMENSTLEVQPIEAHMLEKVLKFIYTNTFDKDNCDLREMLFAAKIFAMNDLMQLCEQELVKQLRLDNAVDFLLFADRQDAKILKAQTLEVITSNLEELLATNTLQILCTTKPTLFVDILKTVCSNK